MIHVVAVLTAFLSGTLLGIVLADRRTRRRQDEERAQRVADALADTVLVDGVELPKPEDARWKRQAHGDVHTLDIGKIAVSVENAVYVDQISIDRTVVSKAYAASVWKHYRNRVARKSVQP